MVLSKNVMRNVARFRVESMGGMKCKTGLYSRSPDRSARVCNLYESGDMKNMLVVHVRAPNNYGHQVNHIFDHISDGGIKGFVFHHNSEAYTFFSCRSFRLMFLL